MSRKYEEVIIFAPLGSYWYCFPFIEATKNAFKEMGYEVSFLDTVDYKFKTDKKILLIIIANPEDKNTREIGKINNFENITTVVYETEARKIEDKFEVIEKYEIYNLDFIWTYTHLNLDTIQDKINVPIIYFPPGYSKIYDYRYHKLYRTEYKPEPITFLHNNYKNRAKILKRYIPSIKNINNCFTFDDYAYNITKYPILINLHQEPAPGKIKKQKNRKGLETLRLAPFLSSGIYVISDHSYKKDEEVYKDLVTFMDIHEMKNHIEYLLQNNQEMKQKIKLRTKIFKNNFKLKTMLENVLHTMSLYE